MDVLGASFSEPGPSQPTYADVDDPDGEAQYSVPKYPVEAVGQPEQMYDEVEQPTIDFRPGENNRSRLQRESSMELSEI
jgi:hypothetical protein